MRAGCFLGVCLLVVIVAWFGVTPASGTGGGPRPADTNPPVGTVLYPLPSSWTNFGYIALGVRFVDPDGISFSSLSMTVDGAAVSTNWGGSLLTGSVSALPDGPHTIEARASDNVGNGPTIVSWSFSIDSVPPLLAISAPTGNPELPGGSVNLAWTGSDAASGIGGYAIRLDEGMLIDVGTATSFPFPELSPGVHYFVVYAYDVARNNIARATMATVPSPPGNATTTVTVVLPDQVPAWAIALVVINAAEAAAIGWVALRWRNEPFRGKPGP